MSPRNVISGSAILVACLLSVLSLQSLALAIEIPDFVAPTIDKTVVVTPHNTYTVPDRIVIRYEGNVVWNSGCWGTESFRWSQVTWGNSQSTSTRLEVSVEPGCATTATTTVWEYLLQCPSD